MQAMNGGYRPIGCPPSDLGRMPQEAHSLFILLDAPNVPRASGAVSMKIDDVRRTAYEDCKSASLQRPRSNKAAQVIKRQ